jgi:hypothetical protein
MFHRHSKPDAPIVAPRVRTVRLLETDEDFRIAVERARAFERNGMDQRQQRVANYEHYMLEQPDVIANVVLIDSARGTELLAEFARVEESQET